MRRRFLVTRPAAQGGALVVALRERDVEAVHVATVAIHAGDPVALAAAIGGADWDWLVVTSVNGVAPLREAVRLSPLPDRTRVAAVGMPTASALRAAGIRVDHVPARYLTVEIAEGLGDVRGARILLARADAATPALHAALLARGARVRAEVAYRTVEGPRASRLKLQTALDAPLDGIAFTSGSTVRGLVALLGNDSPRLAAARRLVAACIGPVTAAEAIRLGWPAPIVADEHTAIGLADAIAGHFAKEISA